MQEYSIGLNLNLVGLIVFSDKAKKDLQEKLKVKTGIRWDYADGSGNNGTTTTENICRRLLHDSSVRTFITEEIPIA